MSRSHWMVVRRCVFIKEGRRASGERLIVIIEPIGVIKERRITMRSQGNDLPPHQMTIAESLMTTTEPVITLTEPLMTITEPVKTIAVPVTTIARSLMSRIDALMNIPAPLKVINERQMVIRSQGNDFPRHQMTITESLMTITEPVITIARSLMSRIDALMELTAPVAALTESPLTIFRLLMLIQRHAMAFRESVTTITRPEIAMARSLITIGEPPIVFTEPRIVLKEPPMRVAEIAPRRTRIADSRMMPRDTRMRLMAPLTMIKERSRRVTIGGCLPLSVPAFAIALSIAHVADARGSGPTPIDAVGSDLVEAFSGYNLIFYGAAVGETAVMAFSGGDHAARVFVQKNVASAAWGNAAVLAGYVLPAVAAPIVWGAGLATDNCDALGAGSAAIQSLAMTFLATVLLEWSTGRPYPLHGGDPHAPDVLGHPEYAREFRPFNFKGDWAWPSGHTSAITSVVAALSGWNPDRIAIPLIGYPVAAAIGAGMIVGDHHWTSDVVAGALVGYAVGSSVGSSFRRRALGQSSETRDVHIVPLGFGMIGGAVVGAW
jgi:membrane-associated phospholipid phosphatase